MSKYWCFTAFNEPSVQILMGKTDPEIEYCTYQQEQCPGTGRLHWQGYIEFQKKIKRDAVKKILCDLTLHLEKRKGTQQEAIAYCQKDATAVKGTRLEWINLNL